MKEKLKPGTLLRVKFLDEIANYNVMDPVNALSGFTFNFLLSKGTTRTGKWAIGISTFIFNESQQIFSIDPNHNISAGIEGLLFIEERVGDKHKDNTTNTTFYRVVCDEREFWVDKNDVVVM